MNGVDLAPLLEQLVAVARTEHLTRAAEQVGVPQPTLSRSMAKLSDQLGTPILIRDGRGVRLTRAGRVLADHSERALAELVRGVRAVQAETSAEEGRVVLGFLHSMGPQTVPTLLRAFGDRRPGVRIELVQDGTDRLAERVLDGSVDLALVSPRPRRTRIGWRELARQDLVLLVPTRHRLSGRSNVAPAALGEEVLITLRTGFGVRTLTDDLLHGVGVIPRYAFQADDLTTVAGLVAAGLGAAVLPQGSGDPDLTREITIDDSAAVRAIALIWASDRTPTAPAAEFRRFVIEHAPAAFLRPSARQSSPSSHSSPSSSTRQPRKRARPSSSRSTSSSSV